MYFKIMHPDFKQWIEEQEYRLVWYNKSWIIKDIVLIPDAKNILGSSSGIWRWDQLILYYINK